MTNDLIETYSHSKKLMPFLHLPVQTGSDKLLKLMNRKHDKDFYLNIVSKLKKINAKIEFSSDFIIGYPGETDNDFNESLDLLMEVKFIQTYSFIYSARPGTPAYNFKLNTLDDNKKKLAKFQKISNEIKIAYRKNLIGSKVKTLFENKMNEPNKYFGRDEYFNSVVVESENNLVGKIAEVKINKINNQTLFGEKISGEKKREFAA